MLPNMHPMKAYDVANHGLPRIKGWPHRLVFGCKIRKSTGYSHESKETVISSSIPFGTTLDLSTSSKIVVVGQIFGSFKYFIVYIVMTFITAPRSIKFLGNEKLLIEMVTISIPGSIYFSIVVFADMRLANFPMTWIVGGSLFFILVFLTHFFYFFCINWNIFFGCINKKMRVSKNIWNDFFTTCKNPNNIL